MVFHTDGPFYLASFCRFLVSFPFAFPLSTYSPSIYPYPRRTLTCQTQVDNLHRLRPSNLDGRAFLRGLAKAEEPCDHVLMNLPATAIDFLGAFFISVVVRGEGGRGERMV